MKPAREPASSRPKPCACLKKPHESCPFAPPCGPRRKKNDRGQRSAFSSENSWFALSILAHRGSALPELVNDRAALRLCRIWCETSNFVLYLFDVAGRPGSSEVPRNPLARWDVSSIPANGIFLTKKLKNKNKNAQRVEND